VTRAGPAAYSALLRVGFAVPTPLPTPRWALTSPFHPCLCRPRAAIGGVFSVALSVASRRPGVTRHPARRSPEFPRPAQIARPRPPGPLHLYI